MTVQKQNFGTPYSVAATGTTSAVATQSGITSKVQYITDIAGSSDKAGSLLTVKQGTTTIWEVQLATTAAGNNSFQQSFQNPLTGVPGGAVSVTVDGTSICKANISGFYF